jgi:hypothetical protein
MWLRAAAVSDVGRVNGPAQGFYRVHGNSMQRTTYSGHAIDLEGRFDAFEKVLVGPEARVAGGDKLLETAKRALATSAVEVARSAYDRGREEPIDDYLAFAARVWPASRSTRGWRTLARRDAAKPQPLDRSLVAARRVSENLKWRARWPRWRWTGV